MTILILGLLTLISIPTFAQDIKPLTTTSDGMSVLGCFGSSKGSRSSRETVVFRKFKGLSSFVISNDNIGMVMVLEGENSTNSRGITGSHMPLESQTILPDYGSENWSYPAPASTILAARGNYIGFFLNDSAEGLLTRHKLYQLGDLTLKCTSDKVLLLEKINSALKFSPM
jgi:hypothetical protein